MQSLRSGLSAAIHRNRRAPSQCVGSLKKKWPSGRAAFAIYRTTFEPADLDWCLEHHLKLVPSLARAQPAFDALRQDREKTLGKQELQELCPLLLPETADCLFSTFDGKVSYAELCAYALLMGGRERPDDALELVFPLLSEESDFMALEDLLAGLKMLYQAHYRNQSFAQSQEAEILAELRDVLASTSFFPASSSSSSSPQEDISAEKDYPMFDTEAEQAEAAVHPSTDVVGADSQEGPSSGTADKPDKPVDGDDPSGGATECSANECNDQADSAALQSEDNASTVPAKMSLGKYVQWARSDRPAATQLRELLGRSSTRDGRSPVSSSGLASQPVCDYGAWKVRMHLQTKFERIKVDTPLVEIDGDEMPRIMWQLIKEKLIFPFLDMELDYHDMMLTIRDETEDVVTTEAAEAIQKYGVAVKCPTIVPDQTRLAEFNLQWIWPDGNVTLQNLLKGAVFKWPIVIEEIPRYVPGWRKPIAMALPPVEQIASDSGDVVCRGPGHFKLVFEPEGEGDSQVHSFTPVSSTTSAVMVGTCTTRERLEFFAKCCFDFALAREMPLYVSVGNQQTPKYDALFSEVFMSVHEQHYKKQLEDKALWVQQVRAHEMVTHVMRSEGGFVWASSDAGMALSDVIEQGFGLPGLATSVLSCPQRKIFLAQASHGTITRHYRRHQKGEKQATNPVATIFSWTQGLAQRARLDGNARLADFAAALEEACITCVKHGRLSRDLAVRVYGADAADTTDRWLSTEDLINEIARELRIALCKPRRLQCHSQAEPFINTVLEEEVIDADDRE
eukprot:TRINITY_DN21965_c0_g1_i1.p1 TRINITY_DN21965_c0_g1~~TRINITY_DN21965_c0_g1_i1.p1  ORF type:complete len:792 (+),score=113.69 TRINITY_DN21965_c0_g1_i1:93-2468(+)